MREDRLRPKNICTQPRAKTSAENVRKLLETAAVAVPEDTAEAHSLAKTMVSEIAERDVHVLKSDEEKIKDKILPYHHSSPTSTTPFQP